MSLRLVGVSKHPALVALDLTVARGELVVLVGPSGAGKSTALRVAAGLDAPDTGRVVIDGRDVTDAVSRDAALVAPAQVLYAHLTVYDNLACALRRRRLPEDRIAQRIAEAAQQFGAASLLGRWPRALSTGERQRVLLAAAVSRAPGVLLLDEPLNGLDVESRRVARDALLAAHRALNAATVYVTHDLHDVETLADRVVVMKGGAVAEIQLRHDARAAG